MLSSKLIPIAWPSEMPRPSKIHNGHLPPDQSLFGSTTLAFHFITASRFIKALNKDCRFLSTRYVERFSFLTSHSAACRNTILEYVDAFLKPKNAKKIGAGVVGFIDSTDVGTAVQGLSRREY